MKQEVPARVEAHTLCSSGAFPNNQRFAVMLYRSAFVGDSPDALADEIEQTFRANEWSGHWRDGVYAYHHYHSTAHEALGCYAGEARVQVGGPDAPVFEVRAGDVLVLPAGTAHCSVEASPDFRVVGAYAGGRKHAIKHGDAGELPRAAREIARVPMPKNDPIYGAEGPLPRSWRMDQTALV
ncbi:MAG: hypothetical protein JWN48_5111 [Myxococcaceae bacterium]|nr:hypothetical protein [Myxococcaceae bacterium]